MQETPVWFLGQEDPLEKGTATHSSTQAWRIPVRGVTKSQTQLSDFHWVALTDSLMQYGESIEYES